MPNLNDIKIDNLPKFRDARGSLVVAEFFNYIPFSVVRLFYIHDAPINAVRGKHAHRRCRQYMICQTGRVLIDATDGTQTRRIELCSGQAVLIENGIFTSQTYVERDTVLLVLCDRLYEKDDYIHSIDPMAL
jgi:UDP-2-acetamido-3-amino-2,3-dideoxy-glucuronate N-acetyltransferase